MSKGRFNVPVAINEPVLAYAPNSKERISLQAKYNELNGSVIDVPMFINGKEVRTGKTHDLTPPHNHQHKIGFYHEGDETHVSDAINAALNAKEKWEAVSWEQRAAIFLKAAELLAGPHRDNLNASTMLAQSKNAYQAEIDAACELIDFFRFNVQYMTELYADQPISSPGIWNRVEYRPLEGFVLAITPFNFTSIAANLPCAPALMGNVVVWKPAESQIYSAHFIMNLLREAGLPDGVINLVYAPGVKVGKTCFTHKDFAGIHFTGSTGTFNYMWKTIGENISNYRSYPRIVGETGGKDFVFAHPSAHAKQVATALSRGAFEFQGQKCSAASRAYIPKSIWSDVKETLLAQLADMKMGSPDDFSNFINAVIDEKAFNNISSYIDHAKNAADAEIISGGNYDKSKGYFIEPTVILTTNAKYKSMCEEIFGPVLTIYVYEDAQVEETLKTLDETSPYALTGAIFGADRIALDAITYKLRNAAGNFYINDKPTGAVVGQQPFGGARASGTNDKAGSKLNLLRWVSVRTIKENFVPPTDYKYPFLAKD